MKDLYTFDYNNSSALTAYDDVRQAYKNLFDELKIPYLVAEADSGDIGGDLSHEFHFPTKIGEDNIISCTKCDYVANEELAEVEVRRFNNDCDAFDFENLNVVAGFSRDQSTLILTWFYSSDGIKRGLNARSIKSLVPEYDLSRKVGDTELINLFSLDHQKSNPLSKLYENITRIVHVIDGQVPPKISNAIKEHRLNVFCSAKGITHENWLSNLQETSIISQNPSTGEPLNMGRIVEGDVCPKCHEPTLNVQKAIELGHTFHLGSRYSKPMEATITVPVGLVGKGSSKENSIPSGESGQIQVPMEMGCHGIGVTRMIGAVAETLVDEKGLNWPRVMAPFEIVVIPGKGLGEDALQVFDMFSNASMDPVVDDRGVSIAWKLKDADLIGYPIIVLLGRKWKESLCEVQCRRLGVKQDVKVEELKNFVGALLSRL